MERAKCGDGTLHGRWSTLRERSRGDALGCVGKRLDAPRTACTTEQVPETNTPEFSLNSKNGVSKHVGAKTVRKLFAKELPDKTDIRKHSPSVIAKLMGLDTLPAQHSKFDPNSKVTEMSQEKYPKQLSHCSDYEDNDFQEFKDIYEVSEISNFNIYNGHLVQKKSTTSELVGEKLLLRKKLMKGKGISIDQNQNYVVDYLDGSEGLDSTKDRFLKILQEPDSLTSKHMHDLRNHSPPKRLSVLKSSKNLKESKSRLGSLARIWNGDDTTWKEHVSPSQRYLDLLMDENHEKCNLPTTIVVLKPRLKDVQDSAKAHPLPHSKEGYYSSYRKHRELRRSGSRDLLSKLEGRQKLPVVVGLPKQSLRSSKEIANKLITKKMREGAENGLGSDKSPTMKRGSASRANFLPSHKKSLVDWDGSSSSSSCSSSESYLRKVARRISRSASRKTIQSMQELRFASRNSLGEVLARKERTDGQNTFATKLRGRGSLGINSRDGWKDVSPSSLSSSRSLPASSSSYGCPESNMKVRANRYSSCKKMISDVSNQSWREHYKEDSRPFLRSKTLINWDSHSTNSLQSDMSSDDLHSNVDEIRNSSQLVDPRTENKPDIQLPQNDFSNGDDIPRNARNYEDKIDCVTEQSQFPESASLSGNYSGESDSSADEVGESLCYVKNSVQTPATSNEAEQPSPISVLEPSFEDETSSSCCFDRVSADLSELRTQLQLLKLESFKYSLSSEEDSEKTGDSFRCRGEIPSRAEQDMELSFLHAVLNTSGIDATDQETLFATCCSLEFPIHLSVFKQLEEMHFEQFGWSISERKLLFDRINIALAEILGERMDERPWTKATTYNPPLGLDTQGLANMVCKLLAAQGDGNSKRPEKDLVKDSRWMETAEDVDRVGKELECFLMEELVEELVSEIAQ